MSKMSSAKVAGFLLVLCLLVPLGFADKSEKKPDKRSTASQKTKPKSATKVFPLNKAGTVLLDKPGNRVFLKSTVVLREGVLEMLACLTQSKEHESILAVDARAYVIHTGLLALNAKPGKPVSFSEKKYKPPTGQKIDIFLSWKDKKGKLHRVPAQQWVRYVTNRFYSAKMATKPADLTIPDDSELRFEKKYKELSWYGQMTKKERDELTALSTDKKYRTAIASFFKQGRSRQMKADWVFAGSEFYTDEKTGEQFYTAEGGDLICVANFPSAVIDVSIQSDSQGAQNILFEPYTERIPPLDTEVTIELIPVFKKKPARKTK